jgi:hypothetical protein
MKSELGEFHPIAILVQMTARFDQASAQSIMDKLEALFTAIERSQIEDRNNAQISNLNFLTLVNEITSIRDHLSTDNSASNSLLTTK